MFHIGIFPPAFLNAFWGRAPIAIAVLCHYAFCVQIRFLHITQPFFHCRIVLSNRGFVAKLLVKHVCHKDKSARPGQVVGVVIKKRRGNVGNRSARFLGIPYIVQPFPVQLGIVEQKAFPKAANCPVAKPRLAFVSLGAVNGHAFVVTRDCPTGILVNLV